MRANTTLLRHRSNWVDTSGKFFPQWSPLPCTVPAPSVNTPNNMVATMGTFSVTFMPFICCTWCFPDLCLVTLMVSPPSHTPGSPRAGPSLLYSCPQYTAKYSVNDSGATVTTHDCHPGASSSISKLWKRKSARNLTRKIAQPMHPI